jgi:alpha-beta hydrolase superfamily lysophospholipase
VRKKHRAADKPQRPRSSFKVHAFSRSESYDSCAPVSPGAGAERQSRTEPEVSMRNLKRRRSRVLIHIGAISTLLALIACGACGTNKMATLEPGISKQAAADATQLAVYRWPVAPASTRAVVMIVHGASEHAARYDRFARFLNENGYAVYAMDLRGHGNTRLRSGALLDAGPDAWNHFVEDQKWLRDLIAREYPGQKVVFFGHSMGSAIAQDYLTRYGRSVDAYILSGTFYGPALPDEVLKAADDAARSAPLEPSQVFAGLFTGYNKPFSANPGFEWLSRDPTEVAKYVHDPLCGKPFGNELTRDFFRGLSHMRAPEVEARIPRDVPLHIISGDQDPVGDNTKSVMALIERYRALGLTKVTYKFYPQARHELLNETNRDEVQNDLLDWLRKL